MGIDESALMAIDDRRNVAVNCEVNSMVMSLRETRQSRSCVVPRRSLEGTVTLADLSIVIYRRNRAEDNDEIGDSGRAGTDRCRSSDRVLWGNERIEFNPNRDQYWMASVEVVASRRDSSPT